jgi:hypothetical protein
VALEKDHAMFVVSLDNGGKGERVQ